MATPKKPAPAPKGAPAPAPKGAIPPPAPLPGDKVTDRPVGGQSPEQLAEPQPTSPLGVILDPHVPAPIPPVGSEEAQPIAQGSLTPAQTEQALERNPAIKAVPGGPKVGQTHQPAPGTDTPEEKPNDDGFLPGQEVHPDAVFAAEQKRSLREREEKAKAAAAKAKQ